MANHKSSEKRIRQTVAKRAHNRLFHKTARNAVKALRNTTDKSAAEALLPKVTSMLDKLAKHNIVLKNKAGNLKSCIALRKSYFLNSFTAFWALLRRCFTPNFDVCFKIRKSSCRRHTHTCSKRSEKSLRATIASWKLTATGVIRSAKSS